MLKNKKTMAISAGIVVVAMICISAYFIGAGKYHSNISFSITMDGQIVAQCKDARVTHLFPKPMGGYRFHCPDGMSVYVVYATGTSDPAKGTLKSISIQGRPVLDDIKFAPLTYDEQQFAKCRAGVQMEAAKGAPLLPITFLRNIKKGTYPMMLAQPCRKLTLKIGGPE